VKTKPQKPDPQSSEKLPDFEQSLSELEALVQKLEQGDVPLEEALATFERGVALTRQCQTALQTAQQKVEVLLGQAGKSQSGNEDNGGETLAPFDDDDADDAGR
jgi:exodeoxyribonuclease VII small subunit